MKGGGEVAWFPVVQFPVMGGGVWEGVAAKRRKKRKTLKPHYRVSSLPIKLLPLLVRGGGPRVARWRGFPAPEWPRFYPQLYRKDEVVSNVVSWEGPPPRGPHVGLVGAKTP